MVDNIIEILTEQLSAGFRTHPQVAADGLKAIVEEARRRAAAGDFSPIRTLADRADEVVEQVKAETGPRRSLVNVAESPARADRRVGMPHQQPAPAPGGPVPDDQFATLAMLAQQVFAMLAILGGSDGRRDSGYYRASLLLAERLDAMTEGALRLVDLVNLVGASENQ